MVHYRLRFCTMSMGRLTAQGDRSTDIPIPHFERPVRGGGQEYTVCRQTHISFFLCSFYFCFSLFPSSFDSCGSLATLLSRNPVAFFTPHLAPIAAQMNNMSNREDRRRRNKKSQNGKRICEKGFEENPPWYFPPTFLLSKTLKNPPLLKLLCFFKKSKHFYRGTSSYVIVGGEKMSFSWISLSPSAY